MSSESGSGEQIASADLLAAQCAPGLPDAAPELTAISRNIISVSTSVRLRARRAIERRGHRASAAISQIVLNLPEAGLGMSKLAKRAGISLQRAGQLVAELEEAGYVKRISAPCDGRARSAVYTDRGRHLLRDIEEVKEELAAELASILGERRLALLLKDLAELDTALGGGEGLRIIVG